jgi:hypothetical protein
MQIGTLQMIEEAIRADIASQGSIAQIMAYIIEEGVVMNLSFILARLS